MDPSNEKLLDLLRLTDRSLAQVDAATLQRMVASDAELRARAERLELVLHASQSIGTDALWHDLDLSDAELTAEILDGAQALEVSTSADLVRHVDELQSITSGERSNSGVEASEIASRSLLDAVNRELMLDNQAAAVARMNGKAVDLEIVQRATLHKPQSKLRHYVMWPIAVGIVAAIVLFVMSLGSQPTPPKPSSPIPERSDIVIESPPQPAVVPEDFPVQPDPEPQTMPQIVIDSPDEVVPEAVVVEAPELRPPPVVPEVERPIVPQRLKWNRISGLVATQVEGSDSWYAIKAESTSMTNSDGSPKLFQALGNSWGEARTESGIRVVLGPGAVARVGISTGDTTKVQLDIQEGKVSVGDLSASTQVLVTHQADQTEWLVSNSDTTLAFDLQQSTSEMQLVQGSLQFDGQAFTGPSKVTYKDGGWEARRLARTAPWLAQPPKLSPAERQLSIIAIEDGDLVAGLMMNRPGMNAALAMAATDWSLSLDPARTIPLALASPVAAQRFAAAEWLVDPQNDLATVRPILAQIAALIPRSRSSVPRWIAAVRGDIPITGTLAQNMLGGLGPSEPMFVREMALASLMNLSGQTFPYYDLRNPNRQAITQITATLRPWINQLP
ncbi:MAG: hypothetical protein H8E66_26055 [Planctomycetes bacterium]|nr:hypothetical protein [Planctomycetota bacterium]